MRSVRTLSSYVGREIGVFASLSILGVTALLASQQLIERLDQLMSVGIDPADLPRVMLFMLALLAPHVLPIGFAFGITLALARLSRNSELLAIASLGVGIRAVLLPAVGVALVIAAASSWLIGDVEPTARLGLRQHLADIALRGTIVESERFRGLEDRVIYVDERSDDGGLRGVMIFDNTNEMRPFVTFAQSGLLRYDDAERVLRLVLNDGQILVDPDARDPDRVQLVSFDTFEYAFDALSMLGHRYSRRNTDEISSDELVDIVGGAPLRDVRKPNREAYAVELYRRQAMPWAPVWFAMAAVGLGMGRARSRALSLVLCTLVVFAYYASTMLCLYLAGESELPSRLAAWLPNLLFGVLGALLVWRAGRSSGE
jgi:lipopolysaccharide export system permease protein